MKGLSHKKVTHEVLWVNIGPRFRRGGKRGFSSKGAVVHANMGVPWSYMTGGRTFQHIHERELDIFS